MKNVHYLIHGDVVNVSVIDTDNPVLKTPVLLVQIVVAFIGIAGIISVMPVAFTMDASRFIQFHFIKYKRKDEKNHKNRVLLRPLPETWIIRTGDDAARKVLQPQSEQHASMFRILSGIDQGTKGDRIGSRRNNIHMSIHRIENVFVHRRTQKHCAEHAGNNDPNAVDVSIVHR